MSAQGLQADKPIYLVQGSYTIIARVHST